MQRNINQVFSDDFYRLVIKKVLRVLASTSETNRSPISNLRYFLAQWFPTGVPWKRSMGAANY